MVYQNLDTTRLILVFPRGQAHILGSLDPSLCTSRQRRRWAWELVLTTIIPGTTPHAGLRVRERAGGSFSCSLLPSIIIKLPSPHSSFAFILTKYLLIIYWLFFTKIDANESINIKMLKKNAYLSSKGNRERKQIGCNSQISQIKHSRNQVMKGCSFSSSPLRNINKSLLCGPVPPDADCASPAVVVNFTYVFRTQSVQTLSCYSYKHHSLRVGGGKQGMRQTTLSTLLQPSFREGRQTHRQRYKIRETDGASEAGN